tara:strand:+ start:4972 stop:8796 length:3825 start_codon:yes stop_codon:yes gene_type:complete
MATTSFTGVHSFRLKYPQYSSFRNKISSKGEWIELYKNRNELPTAKLRTWVLYYRNGGQWYGSASPANGNYIFYDQGGGFGAGGATNNDGRQLGWIWGFPLFNVGATATNWPKWGSCLGNTHGFSGGETHGNEKMLVDISTQRNIIVLDFNGYNVDAFSSNAKSTDKIKDNISETGFYLTLRLKSSQENELKDFTTFFGTAADASPGGWATLVEYVYECDIIGPKDMLDFTLDYFLYLDGNNTKLFGENLTINNRKYKLGHIPSNEANSYHDNLKISIITGLGPSTEDNTVSNWTNKDRLMDTDGIYNDLVYNGTTNKVLQKWIGTGTQETNNRVTVTKIIGGYYSQMGFSTPSQHIGYYGDNFGNGQFQTRMGTHGWNNTTILRNKDCDNGVTRTDSTTNPTYNLNNILWCSLNSPRKKKVRFYGNNGKFNYRFVDNYLDLNGIECSGGGYGRFPNTIDLPRNNLKPYYSSNNNINTINLLKDFNNNLNQYFTDNNERTLNDISNSKFVVYYKLLIPPLNNTSIRIQYTFGMDNQSKVTFFRHSEMSGIIIPGGKSSLNARRSQETIELEWGGNNYNYNEPPPIKDITFIDVASGFSEIDGGITMTDGVLNATRHIEDYDLSFNVFQIQSYSIVGPNRASGDSIELNGNPYQQKTFKIETGDQYIDISSVPLDYEPYRYINIELPYIFNANSYRDISYAPLLIQDEGLKYRYEARYARTNVTEPEDTNEKRAREAKIVQNPLNTLDIPINNINIFGFNYNPNITLGDESFIFFESGETMFDININKIDLKSLDNENITFFRPFTLNLNNNLIPDYWRLFKPINEYFFNSIAEGLKNIPIEYNYQTTVSQMFKISNISVNLTDEEKLKVKYILINSNENNFDISALTENMVLATSNIIIEVTGEEFLNTKLNTSNAIIELKCNENEYNPFGINRVSLIGDKSLPPSNNGGLNVPTAAEPDKRFSMNIPLNTRLSRNNGLQPSNDRRIWNNLYDIQIKFFDDGTNGLRQQNPDLNNTIIGPTDLKVLLVNIPNLNYITPVNEEGYPDISVKLNSDNTSFELNWKGFEFLQEDVSFNKTEAYGGKVGKKIEIIWNIQRESTTTAEVVTLLSGTSHPNLNYNVVGDEIIYTFIDKTVRIFDKYKYRISGVCRWSGLADLLLRDGLITELSDAPTAPSFNINGFVTDEIFICKNNRFPYGRFNTTATNLKLYRPLLLRTVGQRDQFGNVIGGDCSVVQKSRPNVLSDGGSNNNIYINTADQMTRKETFKRLSTLRLKR